MSISKTEFKEKVKKNRRTCFCGEILKIDREGNLYCTKCGFRESKQYREILAMNETLSEEIFEEITKGKKIMLFNAFPIDFVPKMTPLIIEKLNNNERKMYEPKAYYFPLWRNIEDWSSINKFLVAWCGELFLVRMYEN